MTRIGSAHVSIHAKDGGFKREVRKIVDKIDDVKIDLDLDTKQAEESYKRFKDKIEDVRADLILDTRSAEDSYEDLKKKFVDAGIDLGLNTRKAEEDFDRFKDKIRDLTVDINIDTSKARKKLDRLIEKINKLADTVSVDVSTESARRKIDRLSEKIDDLARSVEITVDTTKARKKITYLRQRIGDLSADLYLDTSNARKELDAFVEEALIPLETLLDLDTSNARNELEVFKNSSDTSINADLSLSTSAAEAKLKAFGRGEVRSIRLTLNKTNAEKSLAKLRRDIEKATSAMKVDAEVKFKADISNVEKALANFATKTANRRPLPVPVKIQGLDAQLTEIRRRLRTEHIYIDLALTEATMKSFRAKISEFLSDAKNIKVSVSPNQESIKRTIKQIQESFDKANLTVTVDVEADEETLDRITNADLNDQVAEIRAVAHTAAAEAQLAFAARNRRAIINVNANMSTLSRLRAQILNALDFDIDNSPIIRMFTGPEVSRALQKFTVSVAGVIDPSAVRDQIVKLMANFDDLAVSAGMAATAVGGIGTTAIWASGLAATVANDLSKAVGILAAAPAGAATAFAVLKTWKTAWAGITDAMVYDTEDAMKAIAKMPPALQEAAIKLHAFTKDYSEVVTTAYWSKMGDGLELFLDQIAETMINGFGQIADALADVSLAVVEVFDKATREGKIEVIFENIAEAVRNAETMVYHLTDAFVNMAVAGLAYLPQFTEWLGKLSRDFNEFISNAISSGDFDKWIFEAVELFKQLGSIVWDTIGIIDAFGKIASTTGYGGLKDLADGISNVNDWINRSDVFTRIHEMLTTAKEGFERMAEGVGTFADALFSKSHLISGFFSDTAETIATFAEHLADAFDSEMLWQGLEVFFEGIREGVDAMGPGIRDSADMVGMLAEMFGETLKYMGEGFTILMDLLKDVFEPIHEGFLTLHGPMNEAFQLLTSIVKGPLVLISETIGTIMKGLALVPTPIMTLATGLLMLVGPINALRIAWGTLTGRKIDIPRFDAIATSVKKANDGLSKFSGSIPAVGSAFKKAFTLDATHTIDGKRLGFEKVKAGAADMKRSVVNSVNAIPGPVGTALSSASSKIGSTFSGIGTSISNTFAKAGKSTSELSTSIQDSTRKSGGLKTALGHVGTAAKNIVFDKVNSGILIAEQSAGALKTGVQKVGSAVKNVAKSLGAALFNPVTLGFAAITGAITLWQGVQEGIKQARNYSDDLAKSLDPVSGKFKDIDAAVDVTVDRLEQMKSGTFFSNGRKILEEAGISAEKFAENLLKLDQIKMDKLRNEINMAKEAFEDSKLRGKAVSEAVKMMSDETIKSMGTTREHLESMSQNEFRRFIATAKEGADNIGAITEKAKPLREELNNVGAALDKAQWDRLEKPGESMKGWREAIGRANDQIGVMIENFNTLESKTSTVEQKFAAMTSNMEMMRLDTSSWNDPLEKMWQATENSKNKFKELKEIAKDVPIDYTDVVKLEGSFGDATHAAFNFSDQTAEAASKLNQIMSESSDAIKNKYIGAFDQAIQSGASYSDAMNTAFKSVEGDVGNLQKNLRKIGVPQHVIDGLLDTFGLLEGDLKKSIDIEGKDQAKRDLIEIELAAEAIRKGDYSVYLDFITKDAENNITKFLGKTSDIEKIQSDFELRNVDQAKDLLQGLAAGEWPVNAILQIDDLDAREKKRLLEAEIIRIQAELKTMDPGPEMSALNQQLKIAQEALGIEVDVDADTGKVKPKVDSAVASASGAKVDVGVETGGIPPLLQGVVNTAVGMVNSSNKISPGVDEVGVVGRVGSLFQSVISNANANAKITPDADTSVASGKIGNWVSNLVNKPAQMPVDADTLLGKKSVGELANTAETGAKFPINLDLGQLEHMRGVLRHYQNSTIDIKAVVSMGQLEHLRGVLRNYQNTRINVTTSVSMGQIEHLRGVLRNYQNTRINVTTSVSMGQIEHLRGVLRNYQNTRINVSTSVSMGQVEHMRGVLRSYQNFKVSVSTSVSMGQIEHLRGVLRNYKTTSISVSVKTDTSPVTNLTRKINAIPKRTVPVSVDTSSPNSKIDALSRKIKAVPDKKFSISTDTGQPQTDVRAMSRMIKDIPDKKFKISTDTGQPQTDVRVMKQKIREIPDKKFKITADISQALYAIDRLNRASVKNKSRTITTYTRKVALADGGMFSGSGVQSFANGGINSKIMQSIAAFSGGSEKHVAQIAKGGWPYRVWAEPETGGEAYIPLAKSKRARSTDILEKVAKHFGYSLVKSFSKGGILGNSVRGSGIQSFASGGTTRKIRVPSQSTPRTQAEIGKQLASDLASVFNQFVDNMDNMFVKRKSTPLIDALNNMSSSMIETVMQNGRGDRALAGRANAARRIMMRQSSTSNIWKGTGTREGLGELFQGITPHGGIRKGYNFTLRDIERGIELNSEGVERAKKRLEDLKNAYDSVVDSVASKAREPFSLANSIELAQEMNKPVTVKSLTKSAKAVIARNNKFNKLLIGLRDKGMPPGLLQEVAALGPGEGIPVAEELAKSSDKDFRELKKVYGQLDSSSMRIGKTVGNAMYEAGIAAAEGVVRGMEGRVEKLEKAGLRLSNTLIRAFKKALGIKSPSRVMRDEIGAQIGDGLALGILDSVSNVEKAKARLQNAIDMSDQVKDARHKRNSIGLTESYGRGNNVVYNITTNNPLPETPSETLRKNNRTLSLMGL